MADVFDMRIDQGATYSVTVTWADSTGTPISLSGYSARLQVRRRYADQDAGITPLVSLTSGSGLTLGGGAGTVAVVISAATTQAIPAGTYVYDLEVESAGGVVTRLIQGPCYVSAEVSRG
jgi:hypothetical protein